MSKGLDPVKVKNDITHELTILRNCINELKMYFTWRATKRYHKKMVKKDSHSHNAATNKHKMLDIRIFLNSKLQIE